jgi:hypothetical protein
VVSARQRGSSAAGGRIRSTTGPRRLADSPAFLRREHRDLPPIGEEEVDARRGMCRGRSEGGRPIGINRPRRASAESGPAHEKPTQRPVAATTNQRRMDAAPAAATAAPVPSPAFRAIRFRMRKVKRIATISVPILSQKKRV